MKTNTDIKASEATGAFCATLLNAATVAHILHFQTRSFSHHEALGDLYEGLPDFIDSIVEAFQGKTQSLLQFPAQSVTTPANALDFVISLNSYLSSNRYVAFSDKDTEIQNIIDEIVVLLEKTIYKLTFLA
jgi:hypothetical protein